MLKNHTSDWVFNLGLRLGFVVFLGTLALGLLADLEPVTALTRSGVAFVAFVLLAHAASAIWTIYSADQTTTTITNEAAQPDGDSGSASPEAAGASHRAAKEETAS